MSMSTAYLAVGAFLSLIGLKYGALPFVIGIYYLICVMGSTVLVGAGYWWYVFFASIDLAMAAWLHFGVSGMLPTASACLLIIAACVSIYAGREGGFLYRYYPAIGGFLNTLFLFFILSHVFAGR